MAHENEKELKGLFDKLTDVEKYIEKNFGKDKRRLQVLRNSMLNDLKRQKRVVGRSLGVNTSGAEKHTFAPMTHVFGKPIHTPVTPADTTPTHEERVKFVEEVNKLYAALPKMKPADLMTLAQSAGGDVLVKACAKKAGYANYNDLITDEYIISLLELRAETSN